MSVTSTLNHTPDAAKCFLMLSQVSVTMIRLLLSLNSLEPHEDKLQPKPGQCEHEDHVGEGKAEPGGKVNHISILRKESKENNKKAFFKYII